MTQERIDLVIWLNGLPIIVIELKHEDEGQNCEDAIYESFERRDLSSRIFKFPFAYFAASNTEVKVATNPKSEKNFFWFNAELVNQAETEAKARNSNADALLSNINQVYRAKFKTALPDVEKQKEYIGLLRRYTKLYYFIAQFFELEKWLNDFIVFAEVMSILLIKQGKTSELTQLLKNVNLSKGAVEFVGQSENPNNPANSNKTGTRTGTGNLTPPKATIQQAIEEIKERFHINHEDAIVITEICEEVSNKTEIKQPIMENRNNLIYLRNSAKPRVRKGITDTFTERKMYDELAEPIYVDYGGIISLMGEAVIKTILNMPQK